MADRRTKEETYRRRPLRLKNYDYSQEGAYFVTICTHRWLCILSEVVDNKIRLKDLGKIVAKEWLQTEKVRPNVILDAYVIMPNHFHAIFFLQEQERATQRVAPTDQKPFSGLQSGSIGAVVGQFKSQVTKRSQALPKPPKFPFGNEIIMNTSSATMTT